MPNNQTFWLQKCFLQGLPRAARCARPPLGEQSAMQREGRAGRIRNGLVLRLGPALHNLHTSLLVQQLQSSGLADPEPVVAIELPKAGVSDAMEHLQLLEAMARSIDPDHTSWDQAASSGRSESAWPLCNTLGSKC